MMLSLSVVRPNFHRLGRCMSSAVTKDFSEGILTLRLSSPRTRNALSLPVMRELRSALAAESAGDRLRVVVIRGEGPVFSSGHNLKELTASDGRAHHERVFAECNGLMRDLTSCPAPVLAAVNGVAAAAGCQLVAMCDLAVATEESTFSTPGSNFGLFCSTPGVPLARAVHRKMSAYMLMTGNPITAAEALRSGLVCQVTSQEDFERAIADICNAIKAKSRAVVALGKRFYRRQLELGLTQALEEGGKVMVDNLEFRDAQEGIAAFKEKRTPIWSHTDEKC